MAGTKKKSTKSKAKNTRYKSELRWVTNAKRRAATQARRLQHLRARHARKGILGFKARREARNKLNSA
jgi:hypothetical protein